MGRKEVARQKRKTRTVERAVGTVDDRHVLHDAWIDLAEEGIQILNGLPLRHSVCAGIDLCGIVAPHPGVHIDSRKPAIGDAWKFFDQLSGGVYILAVGFRGSERA